MSRNLLFEMGVEEIPASYILPALQQLAASLESELAAARLSFESTHTLATPRRMTVIVTGVADAQTSETRTVTGPRRPEGMSGEFFVTRLMLVRVLRSA